MTPHGLFIVLEGGDGSGKTGALAALGAALAPELPGLVLTREPGGTPEGNALRGLLLASGALNWRPMAELLLVAAARVQHVADVVAPALAEGRVVISDRYVGSTLAYQGAGHGVPEADIRAVHQASVGGLLPDLTVVLDLDPGVALRRSLARLGAAGVDEGRFERLGLDFHRRVRAGFLAQAAADPARHRVVDADRPPDVVQAAVLAAVRGALAGAGLPGG